MAKNIILLPLAEGFETNLPNIEKKDLVIVATPIQLLTPATKLALKSGQKNILLEKPGDLYSKPLKSLENDCNGKKVLFGI